MKTYIILLAILLTSCEQIKDEKTPSIIKAKRYTDFSGDLMPNNICRFFYKESTLSEWTETQEKCDCYKVGDTIK
jgi:hypothetical protein